MVDLSLLSLLILLLLLYFIVRPRPVKIPIKNRHVFITGGSSGIELALAHRAAAEGARVSILIRNAASKLEEARDSIRLATGVEVSIFSAYARSFDSVKKVIDAADPIDVLICYQGVFVPQELDNQDLEEVRFMIEVNLMGTFNLIKASLPSMKRDRIARGPASIAIMSSQADASLKSQVDRSLKTSMNTNGAHHPCTESPSEDVKDENRSNSEGNNNLLAGKNGDVNQNQNKVNLVLSPRTFSARNKLAIGDCSSSSPAIRAETSAFGYQKASEWKGLVGPLEKRSKWARSLCFPQDHLEQC